MSLPRIPGYLALLTVLAISIFFAGCTRRSAVPVPEHPVAYSQERVQAVDHWRDVAENVAFHTRRSLLERPDLIAKPIFVQPPNNRPFMQAFHDLLKTEMVSRGLQISETREDDTIIMDYSVQTVLFDSSRLSRNIFTIIRDMGISIGSLFTGNSQARGSDNELVITVRMAYNNRYVLHHSYIRYINDADLNLYFNPQAHEPTTVRNRTVQIISR